jgi:hypothetical protein
MTARQPFDFCEKCAIYKKNEQYAASEPLPSWERYFSEHS